METALINLLANMFGVVAAQSAQIEDLSRRLSAVETRLDRRDRVEEEQLRRSLTVPLFVDEDQPAA